MKRVAIKKVRKADMETIGYLSQKKRRWSLCSCGLFTESEADEWVKNKDEEMEMVLESEYYYLKAIFM